MCTNFCVDLCFYISWVHIPKSGNGGISGNYVSPFKETPENKTKKKHQTVFQSACAILYFHQQVHEDFSLSTSLLILVIVFFILVILVDKKWYFFVVLICISLWLIMLNILSCAYCVCLYLLEKFLFRFFAHFLIGWCMFDLFLLNYKVFYIESLVKVICHIYDLGIFYPIL